MIKRYITSTLPSGYRFWETEWFKATMNEYNSYRFFVLVIAHIIGIFIPLTMLFFHLLSGNSNLITNYVVPAVFLAGSLAFLIFLRKINISVPLVLAGVIIGIVLSCYLPGNHDIFIAIFLAYPLLAFHLDGIDKGMIWVSLMTFVALIILILDRTHLMNSNISPLSTTQLIMGFASYAIIITFTWAGERQHCKYILNITKEIVFDSVTSLPEKDALIYSMDTKTNYLVAIVRIDNFGQFVSLFGYEFSDNILQFVVQHIKDIEKDFGFRTFKLRGIEFGILLPLWDEPPSRAELETYLFRIWEKLSEKHIPWDSTKIRLIYRIAGTLATGPNKFQVLSNAYRALKECARTNVPVAVYREGFDYQHESALSSVLRFTVLSENLEKKWFKAVYQPIIDTHTMEVVWYECLLRIRSINGEYEPPVKYLQIAKSTGMDTAIAKFMLTTACDALERCDKDISINITLQDMLNERFLELVLDIFPKVRRKDNTLIFEILERDEITDAASCLNFINRVRELGCKIAIDDFGTGHSNFFNLLNLPVDIVKLDGFLIKTMMENTNARIMLEGITSLFSNMGIPMVAEYVENEELFNVLRLLNVNFVQGYHFGMPGDQYI